MKHPWHQIILCFTKHGSSEDKGSQTTNEVVHIRKRTGGSYGLVASTYQIDCIDNIEFFRLLCFKGEKMLVYMIDLIPGFTYTFECEGLSSKHMAPVTLKVTL